MSLDARLLERLASLPSGAGRQAVELADAGWSAAAAVDCADAVGCRLWELSLRRTEEAPAVGLKERAEELCRRVTGLLEPLAVVEVDEPQRVALLRSGQPGQLGGDRFYYELLLQSDGGSLLRRYQAPHAAAPRRQQVPFALTYEVLAKLVRDLTA